MEQDPTIEDFIKKIYDSKYQSIFTAVKGQNQSGKTDFNLLQIELLHKLGLADGFGANIPIEAPFDIDFIEDFQTLKRHCQMLNPDPNRRGIKRYFFFGSEMGKWLPKDQPWRNTKFIEELQTVRKYGLSFLGDAIDRIDGRVLHPSHFHGVFHKISKDNPKVARYDDWFNGGKTWIYDIPKTSLGFDTWYSANFYMEPQVKEGTILPLNREHEIVFKYLELGSWKKVGISTQEGKRCVLKVLRFHKSHCLHELAEEKQETTPIKSEITKDSVKVTE